MKKNTFLWAMLFLFSINLSMKAQAPGERLQFYIDYKKAINDKTALINADSALYQEALNNGWFDQMALGLRNAEDYRDGKISSSLKRDPIKPGAGRGATCSEKDPFCTQDGSTYAAGVGTGVAEVGPYYDCLGTQPNPAWFFMKIGNSGDIQITETNSSNVDVDFILWGPFNTLIDVCSSLTSNKVVDCSYDPQATEIIDISGSVVGEFYILLITNYSNQSTEITLAKTGGEGETDCSIFCPPACQYFDDGTHNFVSYNDWGDVVTSPPIIVIESPGSGGYPGDLGLRVTDVSGGTWIYDTVNYGGNYLACNENCLCWDMNVVYNDPSITSYHPYIYLFKGFNPQLPFSDDNPQHFAKFTSYSPTGYQEWVNTCAKIKPSPDGTEPPSSNIGEWTWSRGGMDWYDFISDIQGIMFRVDVTGWGSQQEKIRYDSICLGCSPCPKDTTICCDTTLLLSTSGFIEGVFSGPFVSKVGENYEFKMGCENFPIPSPPDYESYSQDVELLYEYTDSSGYSHDCYFTITVDYKTPPPPDCPPLDTIVCLTSEPFWHGIIYVDPAELGVGTHYFDCFWTNACGSWLWSSATIPPTPDVRRKVTVLAPIAGGYAIPDVTVCKSDPPFWHWDRWINPDDYEYGSANVIDYTYIDPCGDTVTGSYIIYVRDWDFICNTDFIDIPEEWFIVSSYVNPFPPYPSPEPSPIIDIFEPEIYLGHFEYALGNNGILWPSGSINTIGNWDVYQGYKVKMNAPGWIELTGEIPEDKTISLNAGANYIPVLSQEFYPAMDIFTQLGDGLIFAFDLNTELLYWPQGGIYSLQVLEPGKGYLVGMTQPGQATYNPLKGGVKNHTAAKPKVYQDPPWSFIRSGSPHLISVERSALSAFTPEDFIGVFNTEGLCAGMSQIDKSENNVLLVAYGNDFTVKTATGLADAEAMKFKIYRGSTKVETDADVTFDASMPNMGLFAENGLSKIMIIKTGATTVDEYVQSDIQIYPNPTEGTFTIEGMDTKINVRIFNAFGEEVYLNELSLPAKIDLSTQPGGIYFIRVETDNSVFFEKLVIN